MVFFLVLLSLFSIVLGCYLISYSLFWRFGVEVSIEKDSENQGREKAKGLSETGGCRGRKRESFCGCSKAAPLLFFRSLSLPFVAATLLFPLQNGGCAVCRAERRGSTSSLAAAGAAQAAAQALRSSSPIATSTHIVEYSLLSTLGQRMLYVHPDCGGVKRGFSV